MYRDTGSSGRVTHSQDGDVLGPVQPPHRSLGLADPLHHGHIMFPVKRNSLIISVNLMDVYREAEDTKHFEIRWKQMDEHITTEFPSERHSIGGRHPLTVVSGSLEAWAPACASARRDSPRRASPPGWVVQPVCGSSGSDLRRKRHTIESY